MPAAMDENVSVPDDEVGEGGVVTAAVLGVQDQQHVQRAGVQLRVVGALEHVEEVLRQRQARLGVADMQRTATVVVAVHIERVGDGRRELGDELDALAHQVLARDAVGILVEGIELQHAAREDVHDVVAFQFDDMQDGLLLERHVVEDQVLEGLELLGVRKAAGEQQEADLLVAETLLGHQGVHEVLDFVAPEIEASLGRHDGAVLLALIAHNVADVGQADQHAGAVFVAQAALDVQLLEEGGIDPGARLHLIGELVDQVFLLGLRGHFDKVLRAEPARNQAICCAV